MVIQKSFRRWLVKRENERRFHATYIIMRNVRGWLVRFRLRKQRHLDWLNLNATKIQVSVEPARRGMAQRGTARRFTRSVQNGAIGLFRGCYGFAKR